PLIPARGAHPKHLVAPVADQPPPRGELGDPEGRRRPAPARERHDGARGGVLYLNRHSRLCIELVESMQRRDVPVAPADAVGAAPHANATGNGKPTPLERLRQELAQLAEQSTAAERKLRALYLGLYPALLPTVGLPAAIEDLARELTAPLGIAIRVDYDEEARAAAVALDAETALHIYRVAQEALRNA